MESTLVSISAPSPSKSNDHTKLPSSPSTFFTASFNESIAELQRGVRTHFVKIMKKVDDEDVKRASLGLGHSFSRNKCAADVNR